MEETSQGIACEETSTIVDRQLYIQLVLTIIRQTDRITGNATTWIIVLELLFFSTSESVLVLSQLH